MAEAALLARAAECCNNPGCLIFMQILIVMMVLLTAGCSHVGREPVAVPAATVAVAPAASVAAEPQAAPRTGESVVADAVMFPPANVATPAVIAPRVAEVEAPAAKAVARAPAAAVALPPKQEAAVPAAKAPLDLKTLESKLKDTKAIGVFTKLSLKNQVDDLLDQFRALYQGQRKITLAELRQPYDLLLMKLLSLLQNDDPALAREISTSREAIWGILADPVKFANL